MLSRPLPHLLRECLVATVPGLSHLVLGLLLLS